MAEDEKIRSIGESAEIVRPIDAGRGIEQKPSPTSERPDVIASRADLERAAAATIIKKTEAKLPAQEVIDSLATEEPVKQLMESLGLDRNAPAKENLQILANTFAGSEVLENARAAQELIARLAEEGQAGQENQSVEQIS